MPNRCEIVDNRASEQAFKIIAKLGINFFFCVLKTKAFGFFFRKIGFFNFYNFLRAPFSSENVIFRFIKIFENFQNGQGTQIFWFLETSMEVDYKIPKSTN